MNVLGLELIVILVTAVRIKSNHFAGEAALIWSRLRHEFHGCGTDFQIIFEYVDQFMQENPPVSIVILTDGYAPFPDEKESQGIPVCWLINNKEVQPPWGTVARIEVK